MEGHLGAAQLPSRCLARGTAVVAPFRTTFCVGNLEPPLVNDKRWILRGDKQVPGCKKESIHKEIAEVGLMIWRVPFFEDIGWDSDATGLFLAAVGR